MWVCPTYSSEANPRREDFFPNALFQLHTGHYGDPLGYASVHGYTILKKSFQFWVQGHDLGGWQSSMVAELTPWHWQTLDTGAPLTAHALSPWLAVYQHTTGRNWDDQHTQAVSSGISLQEQGCELEEIWGVKLVNTVSSKEMWQGMVKLKGHLAAF